MTAAQTHGTRARLRSPAVITEDSRSRWKRSRWRRRHQPGGHDRRVVGGWPRSLFFVVGWVWTRWIDPSNGGTITRYVNGGGARLRGSQRPVPGDDSHPVAAQRADEQPRIDRDGVATGGPDYSFSVTKTPEPETALESYKSSLNRVAGQLASDAGATIVSQTEPIAILDIAVKDVVYRKGDRSGTPASSC